MKEGHLFGGTLLVTGTCIGAGMLALPVSTAAAGFLPSVVTFSLCWLFMCATGLLFLELALWMGEGANIISMAGRILGHWGRGVAWLLYLYLFYSLTVAYVAGGGGVVADILGLPFWLSTALFVLCLSFIVYRGAHAVDRTNLWLVAGLTLAYILFALVTARQVQFDLVARLHWGSTFPSLAVVITSFGFQGLIPSLVGYMRRHHQQIRLAIVIGSFIPFVAYLLWELLILGTVPQETLVEAQTAVQPLRKVLGNPWIHNLGQAFGFCALASSLLGVGLGLRDFLADGLNIKKGRRGRAFLCAMIYLPALGIALFNPHLFIFALQYGGGTGCTLLLGLLPIVMVWVGRYRMGLSGNYSLPGGRPLLLLLALFVFVILGSEVFF